MYLATSTNSTILIHIQGCSHKDRSGSEQDPFELDAAAYVDFKYLAKPETQLQLQF